jgi:predicted HD phosphohydrolase
VRLRRWDDRAKSADALTPSLAHFLERARRCAIA